MHGGWKVGHNLLEVQPNTTVSSTVYKPKLDPLNNTFGFQLSVLQQYSVDGIVISNDEPTLFTSHGQRDATIFNIAIKGRRASTTGTTRTTTGRGRGGRERQRRGDDHAASDSFDL